MRKSERIAVLEYQMSQVMAELATTQAILMNVLESMNLNLDLDAGKWYNRKPKDD